MSKQLQPLPPIIKRRNIDSANKIKKYFEPELMSSNHVIDISSGKKILNKDDEFMEIIDTCLNKLNKDIVDKYNDLNIARIYDYFNEEYSDDDDMRKKIEISDIIIDDEIREKYMKIVLLYGLIKKEKASLFKLAIFECIHDCMNIYENRFINFGGKNKYISTNKKIKIKYNKKIIIKTIYLNINYIKYVKINKEWILYSKIKKNIID